MSISLGAEIVALGVLTKPESHWDREAWIGKAHSAYAIGEANTEEAPKIWTPSSLDRLVKTSKLPNYVRIKPVAQVDYVGSAIAGLKGNAI